MSDLAQLLAEDAKARERALDPARSFVVQAPAGSGKTELLTQRVLRLLAIVDEPEEILAITFTRKAAGEMRERILKALLEAADPAAPAPDAPHKQLTRELARAAWARNEARGWALAAHPARLQVQTIDAFNMALVRQLPVLARFGVTPAVTEEPEPLYAAAARATLQRLNRDDALAPAVATLLKHLDGDIQQAVDLLAGMLAKRDQWLPEIGLPEHADRAYLEAMLKREVDHQLAQISTVFDAWSPNLVSELVTLADGAGQRLAKTDPDHALAQLAGLESWPVADSAMLPVWRALADLVLTQAGGLRKTVDKRAGFGPEAKVHKDRMLLLLSALSEDAPAVERAFGRVRELPPGHYTDTQWEMVAALLKLLPQAAAELKLCFAEQGQVDYAEVAEGAVFALGDDDAPTDLGLALDARLKHLLIDEFQDTSVAQYGLIKALTRDWEPGDGRTLFTVGDPMQSIYRFRKAEVGLFLRACNGRIGHLPIERLVLRLNTRSTPHLVEWFNATFPKVLPERDDVAAGAVSYNEASSLAPSPPQGERAGVRGDSVQVHALLDASHDEESERIAELIAQERAANPEASIAVLVAGRAHLAGLVPRLRERGLGYRAVDIESLADRPVVQDLTALTRALVHPGDRTAWLAVLRAPWCGLQLADLLALVGTDANATIPELLAGHVGAASGRDASHLARCAPVLLAALDHPRGTLAERIAGLWHALGGPAATREARDLEDARAFLKLLAKVEAEPEGFDLARLERRVNELKAPLDPQGDPRLQLMTIHKSKGLEFDVVIVPGLGRQLAGDRKQLMQWIERPRPEDSQDVLFGPVRAADAEADPLYKFIARLHAERATHERGRLFYVACTRARFRLHLVGSLATSEDDEGDLSLARPAANSLLNTAWRSLGGHFETALVGAKPTPQQSSEDMQPQKTDLSRLTRKWLAPAIPAAVAVTPIEARPEAEEGIVFDWAGETARHVGTVVHRLLAHIAETGVENYPDAASAKTLLPMAERILVRLGVPPGNRTEALARIEQAIGNTLTDDKGRWILSAHPEAASELQVSGVFERKVVHARIDRTFVDDSVRWIIDFKTSSQEGGQLNRFLEQEAQRYRPQLEKYAQLVPASRTLRSQLGLYFPAFGDWKSIS